MIEKAKASGAGAGGDIAGSENGGGEDCCPVLVIFFGDSKWSWIHPDYVCSMSAQPEEDKCYLDAVQQASVLAASAKGLGGRGRAVARINLLKKAMKQAQEARQKEASAQRPAAGASGAPQGSSGGDAPGTSPKGGPDSPARARGCGASAQTVDDPIDSDPLTRALWQRQQALGLVQCSTKHGLTPAWVVAMVAKVFSLQVVGLESYQEQPPAANPDVTVSGGTVPAQADLLTPTPNHDGVPSSQLGPSPASATGTEKLGSLSSLSALPVTPEAQAGLTMTDCASSATHADGAEEGKRGGGTAAQGLPLQAMHAGRNAEEREGTALPLTSEASVKDALQGRVSPLRSGDITAPAALEGGVATASSPVARTQPPLAAAQPICPPSTGRDDPTTGPEEQPSPAVAVETAAAVCVADPAEAVGLNEARGANQAEAADAGAEERHGGEDPFLGGAPAMDWLCQIDSPAVLSGPANGAADVEDPPFLPEGFGGRLEGEQLPASSGPETHASAAPRSLPTVTEAAAPQAGLGSLRTNDIFDSVGGDGIGLEAAEAGALLSPGYRELVAAPNERIRPETAVLHEIDAEDAAAIPMSDLDGVQLGSVASKSTSAVRDIEVTLPPAQTPDLMDMSMRSESVGLHSSRVDDEDGPRHDAEEGEAGGGADATDCGDPVRSTLPEGRPRRQAAAGLPHALRQQEWSGPPRCGTCFYCKRPRQWQRCLNKDFSAWLPKPKKVCEEDHCVF